MTKFWRYFRLDGEPPVNNADWFTLDVHHGGRFYRLANGNRQYRGGVVVSIDNLDPDKTSWPCLNCFAEDLGYREPPMTYWFKVPGSKDGEGFLPLRDEKEVAHMLIFIQCHRILQLYIVGGGVRKKKELELEDLGIIETPLVIHAKYIGNAIDDLQDVVQESNMPIVNVMAGDKDKRSNVGCDGLSDRNKREKDKGKRKVPEKGKKKISGGANAFVNVFANVIADANSSECVRTSGAVVGQPRIKKMAGRIKHRERRYDTRFKGKKSCVDEVNDGDNEADQTSDSDDTTYEELVDSDYDIQLEDDEVLFMANVDGDPGNVHEYEDMGFAGHISDSEKEDSDKLASLSESESSDDEVPRLKGERRKKKKFSKWREFNKEIDLKKPEFEIGMAFPNSESFKDAVRVLAVLTRKELRFDTNDKKRVKVVCKTTKGCPFRIWASTNDDSPTMFIKTLKMEHMCSELKGKVYHCNASFIAKGYLDGFIRDKNWSREGIQATVKRDYGMQVGYQMCYRAKKCASKMAEGTVEDQYNLLESYAVVLKKTNPNTSVWIDGNMEGEIRRFKRMYICYGALKKGWKEGCRPVIGLDGCHLKSVHKGQLLAAVGIDGNNGMYPIAFAVVEKETRESWTWFLLFLKDDLCLDNEYSYTFISDKQKGLLESVKDLFPNSEHRHCVRHLYNNFKADGNTGLELKGMMWAAARSTTKTHWQKDMDTIHVTSLRAFNWLSERHAQHWSRSHFKVGPTCDILCNNLCESFNASILECRKMPILGFLEELRINLMKRLANRRCAVTRWKCGVGPRITKLLKKNADRSHEYTPLESSHLRFQVQGKGVACASGVTSLHDVNLQARTCSCRRWDLCGLPCPHAIAAIYSKGYSPEEFVHEAYGQKKYMLAYEPAINPIPGVDEWEVVEKPILPPKYTRGPGRPKTSRNKEPDELPPPPGTTKLPKSYYQQITCRMCGKKGHNKRTCARRNGQGTASQAEVQYNIGNNVDPFENVEHVETPQMVDSVMEEVQSASNMQPQNIETIIGIDSLREEVQIAAPSETHIQLPRCVSSQPVSSLQPSLQAISNHQSTYSQPTLSSSKQLKSLAKKHIPFRKPRQNLAPKAGPNKTIWRP